MLQAGSTCAKITTLAEARTAPEDALRIEIVRLAEAVPMPDWEHDHERVVPRLSHDPMVPEDSDPLLSWANTSNSDVAMPDTQVLLLDPVAVSSPPVVSE